MSHSRLATPVLRGVIGAAVSSVAMMLMGCADQPAAQNSSTASVGSNAVQASDTSKAPAASADPSAVSMAFPTGNRASSDLLVEEMMPREARVGQPLNYQIRVTNLRNMALTGVVLEQRIPANLQLSNDGGSASAGHDAPTTNPANATAGAEGDKRARIDVGDLGPNQSKTVQMTGTPTQQGTIDTCLTARYNAPVLCSMINVVAPALGLVAEGPSKADLCEDLAYRYTITNTGTGTAHNVVLEEALPDGLRTIDGQQAVSANVGDLTAGQAKSVTVRLKAGQPGSFTTTAAARSDDAGKAQAQQVATSVLAPRLSVTVAGPKDDYLGQTLTYQVTVKNGGDAAANNTKVRLGATPGSVTFLSAQNADGSKLSESQAGSGQELGTLAPGESKTIAIMFKSQIAGDLTLDATAEAKCAQPVTTPVTTRIQTITASALVVTHDPDPVRAGNDVVYHISVENKGSAPDHNVTVTAVLPASEQFVKGGGGTTATADGVNVTFGVIPELAPKQVVSWDVEAKALRPDESAQVKVSMTSDANKTAAVKIEPTKLYGDANNNQERTNVAPPANPVNPPAPPTPTPPAPTPAPSTPTPPTGDAPNK